MTHNKMRDCIQQIVGKKLNEVLLACEMLRFYFDGDYGIHAVGFVRIIKGSDILLTTLDYQNWDEKIDTNNDEWYNLECFKKEIIGGKVVSVKLTKTNDLFVLLDNDVKIEMYNANGYFHFGEENEQWRFMFGEYDSIVINNKSIDFFDEKQIVTLRHGEKKKIVTLRSDQFKTTDK